MNKQTRRAHVVAKIAASIAGGYISDPACAFPMDSGIQRKLSEMFVGLARTILDEAERAERADESDRRAALRELADTEVR